VAKFAGYIVRVGYTLPIPAFESRTRYVPTMGRSNGKHDDACDVWQSPHMKLPCAIQEGYHGEKDSIMQ
jgi:hypothetical protein